jgi:HAD superfamily hydrolase (TIGR01490 family)
MRLALFDLDNTLLAGDSDYEWGQFLIDRGVLDRSRYEAQNSAYYEQYVAGTLDIHEYLGFALRPLAEHSAQDLARWHAQFMRERIAPMIQPAARALVRSHLERGDLCAIITATNSFVTAPIAREFGVPHLIATEPESRDGRFTGRVAGTPCFREGKVRRLEEWLAALGRALPDFSETSCYSDSHNDLPLLERVGRPVAVDPDEPLARHAAARGWKVISLRAGTAPPLDTIAAPK